VANKGLQPAAACAVGQAGVAAAGRGAIAAVHFAVLPDKAGDT